MTDLDKQSATPLRAACIHGRYEKHQASILYETQQIDHGQEMPTEWPCPGGREVTIDIEAGIEAWWRAYGSGGQYNPATRAALAAAIGDIPSTITSADWFNRDDNI